MEGIFINFFGKPEGIIISQLISACRFTIYLSLIAFIDKDFPISTFE